MRVLHLGNVANNGYINVKFLRRAGVQADAVCDERHIISQPEWEEADVATPADHFMSLEAEARAAGWARPDWVIPVYDDPSAHQRFKGQYWLIYHWKLATNMVGLRPLYLRLAREYEPLRNELGELTFGDVVSGFNWAWMRSLVLRQPLSPLLRSYDVTQAYATHPILTMINAPDQPCVAYEHGTLRELPFEDSFRGRLMSLAYLRADKVIITNADVISSVRRLGLENYVFVPHPIDELKYSPAPSQLRGALEAAGADLVLLSPSRHDWQEKGNDLLLRGFAELVRRDRPAALLVLTEWGTQVEQSKRLIGELGMERNVEWLPPLAKVRLLDAYRAADIVLDQFLIGTLGGIAPEAMACAKPVVMAFDGAIHRSMSPSFRRLPLHTPRPRSTCSFAGSPGMPTSASASVERAELGERRYCSRIVVEQHQEIYDAILDRGPAATRAPTG